MKMISLNFSDKVVVDVVKVELPVSERDIDSLIDNAFNGGIGYWAGLDNTGEKWKSKPITTYSTEYVAKLLLDGETVELYDVEDEEERWELTLEKLIKGIELNYKNRPHDSDIENGDAITADCIIQYALFDEIVYG